MNMARMNVPFLCACLLLASVCQLSNAQSSQDASGSQTSRAAQHVQGTAQLPQGVYAIRSCLPFNVLIQPNQTGGSNGTFEIVADPSVVSGVEVTFSNGVLALNTKQGFRTRHHIRATVTLPDPSALLFVQNFATGDLVVGPGFTPPNFTASATGIGSVIINGLSTADVHVVTSGVATVTVNGSLQNVYANLDGMSKAFLTGSVAGNVSLKMNGITQAFIQGTPSTIISGTVDNLAKVLYTDGQCSVSPTFQSLFGINIFGDPCNKVAASTAPTFNPVWTCGLLSEGQSDCSSPGAEEGTSEDESTEQSSTPSSSTTAGTTGTTPNPTSTNTPTTGTTPNPTATNPPTGGTTSNSRTTRTTRTPTTPTSTPGTTPTVGATPTPTPTSTSSSASDMVPPVTGADVRTVSGPAGTVTTGTYTSGPGATATAGGSASRPGLTPLSIFQQSIGGNTWPNAATTTTTPQQSVSQSQTQAGGPRPQFGPLPQVASPLLFGSSWPSSTLLDVSIPSIGSGLSTVSLDCDEQQVQLPMLG